MKIPFGGEMSGQAALRAEKSWASLLGLLNIFVIALILWGLFIAWQSAKVAFGADKPLEITVSGEGKVSAKPDVARLQATIVVQHASLQAAQTAANTSSKQLTDYLKGAGIAEKDIRTTYYNISPRYNNQQPCDLRFSCPAADATPRIVGYDVRVSYEITVRDLAKAGDILSGVVSAGANEVGGLSFTIDKPSAVQAEARGQAILDAKKKADELARSLGKRVGKITQFSEGGSYPPVFYARDAVGKGGTEAAPSPSVAPGEQEIISNVAVTYQFK